MSLEHVKFLVLSDACLCSVRRPREKEKVGRGVSLSIDLQGVSELDRDAVIASYKTREKYFVIVQRCIACAKVLCAIPAISSFAALRCKCKPRQRRSRKKLVCSCNCHLFSLHIFFWRFINRIQEISLNGRPNRVDFML